MPDSRDCPAVHDPGPSRATSQFRDIRTTLLGLAIACGVVLALGSVTIGSVKALALVAVPIVLWGVWFAVVRPTAAAVAMVVVELANVSGLAEQVTPVPLFRVSLLFGLVAVIIGLTRCRDRGRILRAALLPAGLVAVFLMTQLVAVASSVDPVSSRSTVIRYAVDFAFMLVLLLLMVLGHRPWTIAAAVVVPLALLSALGLFNEFVMHGVTSFGGLDTVTAASGELVTTRRHGGPLPDSNFWGRHLVMGLPLALALTVRAFGTRRTLTGLTWAACAVAVLGGIYLTQSRGTFLAGALAVFVWVVASGRTSRRRGLASLPLLLPLLLLPGIGDRLVALVRDVTPDTVTYGIDPSILGRTAAQEIAWAMFHDRPVFGFGPGTYTALVPEYAGRVATAVLQPTDAPHNLYAQVAAESGLIGLAGWLVMFGGLVLTSAVAVVRLERHRPDDRTLAAATLAAMVAYAGASIFLHIAFLRSLGVVLALSVAVLSCAGPALPAEATAQLRRLAAGRAWVAIAGLGAALVVLTTQATHSVVASRSLTVLSSLPVSGYQAYALDIRSRDAFLPTLASIMQERAPSGSSFVADPVRGLITVSADGADDDTARRTLSSDVVAGRQRLLDVGAVVGYEVRPVGVVEVREHSQRSLKVLFDALLLGVFVAAASHLWLRRACRRRGASPDPDPEPDPGPSFIEHALERTR